MLRFILKRLLIAIPLLFGISLVSFFLMKLTPGDPTQLFVDPNISAKDLLQIKENLGLNRPLLHQYGVWISKLCQGDFGFSYVTGRPVLDMILERLPATLLLTASSLIVILLLSTILGVWSAYKKERGADSAITFFSFVGLSLPTFWLGLMLMYIFSVKLSLFPSSGYSSIDLSERSFFGRFLDIAWHLMLPLFTVVLGGLAGLTRYFRFGMIGILEQDYIKAAKARGISTFKILFKHALKNALIPIVTLLGMQLPELFGGMFVIEYIFAWPGMGKLGVDAIFARDYPVIMGTLFFSSLLVLLGSLLSDLAYGFLDPRIDRG